MHDIQVEQVPRMLHHPNISFVLVFRCGARMLIHLMVEGQSHKKVDNPPSLGGLPFIKNATHTAVAFLLQWFSE